MTDPRADVVAQQYERWQYPEPIQNLEAWLTNNWQWYDPSHAHRMLWPDRPYEPELNILIAGCGTNQAAVFAYNNRAANVTAIDISQPSLDHSRYLKDKYSLKNLKLKQLPIEEAPTLGKFDLIVSTGVLHHMADPSAGMKALAECLNPEGVAALMVYARYGRSGVELMQAVFRELGLSQDEESLEMVKAAIATLPPSHPLRSYLAIAPDLAFDAGLVDTFLHGRDRSYTAEGCRELVVGAGLVFQDWFLKTSYYPPTLLNPDNGFYNAIDKLPEEQIWSVMERLKTQNACHFFMACHKDRPESTYKIDFRSGNALDYIPVMRYRAGMSGHQIYRNDWRLSLDPTHLALAQQIDGERTIREIVARVNDSGVLGRSDGTGLELVAFELFEGLWRMDFIAFDLSAAAAK